MPSCLFAGFKSVPGVGIDVSEHCPGSDDVVLMSEDSVVNYFGMSRCLCILCFHSFMYSFFFFGCMQTVVFY
jgi:hypothetical protein